VSYRHTQLEAMLFDVEHDLFVHFNFTIKWSAQLHWYSVVVQLYCSRITVVLQLRRPLYFVTNKILCQ